MKKVVIVNGSPKGEASNTWQLTQAYLRGLKSEGAEVTATYVLKDMQIHNCLGCMSCWGKTPGRCVINDCMNEVYEKIMEADIIIESFPLFFFGMPGIMKNFQDRCLPLTETYRGSVKSIGNAAFHGPRNNMDGKKLVIISTCGYGRTDEIYDALIKQLNYIAGEGKYTKLLCPQGEMFAIPPMKSRIDEYVKTYEQIGALMARDEEVPDELITKASEPILPQRAFESLVTRYWDSVTPKEE